MRLIMTVEDIEYLIENIEDEEDIEKLIEILRPIAVNNKSKQVLGLIKKAMDKSKNIKNAKLIIFLFDLQIRQIYHLNDQLERTSNLLAEMKLLTESVKDKDCDALVSLLTWYVEKLKGNKTKSSLEINKAMKLVNGGFVSDSYTYFSVKYSYAIEEWLEFRNPQSADLLEECVPHFLEKAMYRSLAQSLGILSIIYQKTNNYRKARRISEKIMMNRKTMEKLSLDIKSIAYYLAGVGQILQSNLKNAEVFFTESLMIFESIRNSSLYYDYYYSRNIAHIVTIQALLGNWDSAFKNMKGLENALGEDNIINNSDKHSRRQVPHTLNLIKFYIYSRLQDFDTNRYEELIDTIYMNLEKQYSNPILLIEYIINAGLDAKRLKKLSNSEFDNLKRVRHIIDYEILRKKIMSSNQPNITVESCIEVLKNKTNEEKETYLEEAFTDLLIAKELFSIGDYDKIHLLLKKYDKRIDRLEVLEFRIFMEAFIQVGAYKTGDPLGPALQYMSIKKCRQYGFSKLENKLLNYLSVQGNETLRQIV